MDNSKRGAKISTWNISKSGFRKKWKAINTFRSMADFQREFDDKFWILCTIFGNIQVATLSKLIVDSSMTDRYYSYGGTVTINRADEVSTVVRPKGEYRQIQRDIILDSACTTIQEWPKRILTDVTSNDNTNIDRYDRTVQVEATKTTERESRDLEKQPKIKLNRYDRKIMLTRTGKTKTLTKTDTTEENPTNTI